MNQLEKGYDCRHRHITARIITSYSTSRTLPYDFPHLELITLCDKGVDPTLRRHDHQTLGASIWHATFLLRRIKAMKAAIYLTFKYSIEDKLGLGGRRKPG